MMKALASVLMLAVFVFTAPTVAVAIEVPAQEWNMCSNHANRCWTDSPIPVADRLSPNQKADLVIFLVTVSDPRPWVVTLQEVCSAPYEKIRDALIPLGYTPDRVIGPTSYPNCNRHGSAMFTLGSAGTYRCRDLAQGGACNPSIENRRAGCRVKGTYIGLLKVCVSHPLYSIERERTAGFYYDSSNGMNHDQRLLGADMNETPSGLPYLYAFNQELDYRDPPATTFNAQYPPPQKKIDYLFFSVPSWRVPDRLCSAAASDHCYFFGSFHF
jgi:hypothetical protein